MPYKVTFNNNSGTSTSKTYTSLDLYAAKNQKITLPEVPKAKGYINLGWTTTVSYTYLDVYKRQLLDRPLISMEFPSW